MADSHESRYLQESFPVFDITRAPLLQRKCIKDGPLGPSLVVSIDIGYPLSDLRIIHSFLPLHAATWVTGAVLLDRRNRSAMILVRKSWICRIPSFSTSSCS